MKSNENGIDRIIRIVAGIAALAAAFVSLGVMNGNILGIVVAAVGAILLVTGFVGFCPAYRIVGMSTCKKECCGCGTGECKSE